ncbi:MAG: hypothetical protein WC998_06425 [Candidatus Paceibacterota bacterium]|jgi:hypothetical protein
MNNDRTLSGAIVLVKGTSWISRQIIFHMKIYAKLKHKKPLPFSHGEVLLWNEVERNLNGLHLEAKTLYTIGARESGAEISKASEYYHGEYLILKPVKPLTVYEEQSGWTFWTYVDKTKYQYSNFISWIQYIKTFGLIWIGRKGAQTNYCFELCSRFVRFWNRWPSNKSNDQVSSYDLYDLKDYKPQTN